MTTQDSTTTGAADSLAVPAASLIAKPWPYISERTALWLARGLYTHHCPSPVAEGGAEPGVAICFEAPPAEPRSKKERLPRLPVGFETHAVHAHEGPYAPIRNACTLARSLWFLTFIALRRSLGRTRHPWVWFFVRQTAVIAPLVAIAGAAGQSLLIAQVMVVSALTRLLTRGLRFQLWIARYHFRACPDPDAFVSTKAIDVGSTGAALLEASPLLVGSLVLWPFLAPGGGTFLAFAATVLIATLVTLVLVAASLPVLVWFYENDHPDVRPIVSFAMVIVFAAGMFVYSPLTVLSVPPTVHTITQCLPWTPWLFLPLSVGADAPPMWTLLVSGLLTVTICAALFFIGRSMRLTDPSAVEDDGDLFDDDDEDDETPRTARR